MHGEARRAGAGEEEGEVDVAERDDEGEHRGRHEARAEQGQRHLEEGLKPAGPQAHRRLFEPRVHADEAGGHTADGVGRRDDDVANEQRHRRGRPGEPRQIEVHRGPEQDMRDQERRQEERLDGPAAPEPETHEADRREAADEGGGERGEEPDHLAHAERADEHLAGEERLVPAQGQAFRREVEGRRGAERHGSHHHERGEQQRVNGDRERPEKARRAAAHRAVSSRARRREAQSARPTSPSIKSARTIVRLAAPGQL